MTEEPKYVVPVEDYSDIMFQLQLMNSRMPLWEHLRPLRELTPEEEAAAAKRWKHYQRWRPYKHAWYIVRHPWQSHVDWIVDRYGYRDD